MDKQTGMIKNLEATINEKEKELARLKSELEFKNRQVEDADKYNKSLCAAKDEFESKAIKYQKEYQSIAEMFGADLLTSTSFMSIRLIQEKLENHRKASHELVKAKEEVKDEQAKLKKAEAAKDAMETDRNRFEKAYQATEHKLAHTQREFLNTVKELQALMVSKDLDTKQILGLTGRIEELEKKLKKKDESIADLEKEKVDMKTVESEAVTAWDDERRLRECETQELVRGLECTKEHEISQLVQKIDRLKEQLKAKHEWVDMGREIGKLVKVKDVDESDLAKISSIFKKVVEAIDEATSQKRHVIELEHQIEMLKHQVNCGASAKPRSFTSSLHGNSGFPTSLQQSLPPQYSSGLLQQTSHSMHGSELSFEAGDVESAQMSDYLKKSVRKATEAMAKAKHDLHDFREAVAKALKFGNRARKVDVRTILARVNNLVSRAGVPLDGRFDALLEEPKKGKTGKPSTAKEAIKIEKKLEKVQKKLRDALQTIEAQDMWIAVLQTKAGDRENLVEGDDTPGELAAAMADLYGSNVAVANVSSPASVGVSSRYTRSPKRY